MADNRLGFGDLIEPAHTANTSNTTLEFTPLVDLQIIADLPALQEDLRSLFCRLTDEIEHRAGD